MFTLRWSVPEPVNDNREATKVLPELWVFVGVLLQMIKGDKILVLAQALGQHFFLVECAASEHPDIPDIWSGEQRCLGNSLQQNGHTNL